MPISRESTPTTYYQQLDAVAHLIIAWKYWVDHWWQEVHPNELRMWVRKPPLGCLELWKTRKLQLRRFEVWIHKELILPDVVTWELASQPGGFGCLSHPAWIGGFIPGRAPHWLGPNWFVWCGRCMRMRRKKLMFNSHAVARCWEFHVWVHKACMLSSKSP